MGWPIGLDQFFEGKTNQGIQCLVGWLITFVFISIGLIYPDASGLLVIGLIVLVLFFSRVPRKLVIKLRAFVAAED